METKAILKKLSRVYRSLAELKELSTRFPDPDILLNTLGLLEAKDSSAIENCIATLDDLYKAEVRLNGFNSEAAREVQTCFTALKTGNGLVTENHLLTKYDIIEVQSGFKKRKAGFRKAPGRRRRREKAGVQPQTYDSIVALMANLEQFINDESMSDLDSLVKMAIIHHRFESIYPFRIGNGRTGRIIDTLYLVMNDILEVPVLGLSGYILAHKGDYYELMKQAREKNSWENWILYILEAVHEASLNAAALIRGMDAQMKNLHEQLKKEYKFYSPELVNSLFRHPYTKIGFIVKELQVTRITAAKYLDELAEGGVLRKEKLGTGNYFVNERLFELLDA